MRIDDDPALGGLAEDLRQAHDRNGSRCDDVAQNLARVAGPDGLPEGTTASTSINYGSYVVLALLVGVFHTALFVVIRGTAGGQLPLLLAAAVLGAWAGDALGARLGIDLVQIDGL